jgi:hypothetical protein
MANQLSLKPESCAPYATVKAAAQPEPPELGYRLFTPEFLDELEEYHRVLAVGRISA